MNLNATILGQMISFILFIWFCMKYIWPTIINVIENRKKEIIKGLQNLENAKKEIKIFKLQSKKMIINAKEQAKNIILKANQKKSIILEDAIHIAKKNKERIIAEANIVINIEKNKIKQELIQEINILAIKIAKKIINTNINKNNNIIESLINNL